MRPLSLLGARAARLSRDLRAHRGDERGDAHDVDADLLGRAAQVVDASQVRPEHLAERVLDAAHVVVLAQGGEGHARAHARARLPQVALLLLGEGELERRLDGRALPLPLGVALVLGERRRQAEPARLAEGFLVEDRVELVVGERERVAVRARLGAHDARVRELEQRVALDRGAQEADLERLGVRDGDRNVPPHALAHGVDHGGGSGGHRGGFRPCDSWPGALGLAPMPTAVAVAVQCVLLVVAFLRLAFTWLRIIVCMISMSRLWSFVACAAIGMRLYEALGQRLGLALASRLRATEAGAHWRVRHAVRRVCHGARGTHAAGADAAHGHAQPRAHAGGLRRPHRAL
ncbi:MAG: hypothetical protein CL844_03750 [Crocinitomicaceae bacterium]|nr:hypothetical protein [Crocinitomicaceae bacterium]